AAPRPRCLTSSSPSIAWETRASGRPAASVSASPSRTEPFACTAAPCAPPTRPTAVWWSSSACPYRPPGPRRSPRPRDPPDSAPPFTLLVELLTTRFPRLRYTGCVSRFVEPGGTRRRRLRKRRSRHGLAQHVDARLGARTHPRRRRREGGRTQRRLRRRADRHRPVHQPHARVGGADERRRVSRARSPDALG